MSKLAWHLQNIPGWANAIINSEYVKLIDPPDTNPLPGRRIIGRVYMPDEESNALIAQGSVGVAKWWGRVGPLMLNRPYVWAWCLPNEPQPVADWTFCNLLAAFTIEAARIMHSHGLRVIGGELAEGNPGGATDTERANLFCSIARGLAVCDYWSQHAYWVPDGYPHPEAGYNQWHALRYQMNRGYARARGIKLPPVLLTEAGWDFGIVGKPREGWVGKADWDTYFADLKRFDADLMLDPDCLSATIFVSGANLDWWKFEVGEAPSRSLAAYIGQPIMPPIDPPTPEVPPMTVKLGSYVDDFNLKIVPFEQRPDVAYWKDGPYYRIIQVFTTRDGSWEPSTNPGSIDQWAVDAWHSGADWKGAGGTNNFFIKILDRDGKPLVGKGLYYWQGAMTADPSKLTNVNQKTTWQTGDENLPVWDYYNPGLGETGDWSGATVGRSDVLVGVDLPYKWHTSTFVVMQETISEPTIPPTGDLELDIRNLAYNNIGLANGIPYNPTLAFPREATRLGLGAPLTLELRQLAGYVIQGFATGILYCVDGDWGNIKKLTW